MAVTIRDLLNIPTAAQLVESYWSTAIEPIRRLRARSAGLINQLINQNIGLVVGAYQSAQLIAFKLSDIRQADGPWLEILAAGFYNIQGNTSSTPRNQATSAQGVVILDGVLAIGPVSVSSSVTGITYNGVANATGSGVSVTVISQTVGPTGNCPGSDLVPGGSFTISASTPGDTTWLTSLGAPTESDAELRQRCYDQIQAQGVGFAQSVAAQVRIATSYNVARVLPVTQVIWQQASSGSAVLNSFVVVYCSGAAGDFSSTWDSTATTAAQQWLSPSFRVQNLALANLVQHCPIQTVSVVGSLNFVSGTDPTYRAAVQQGLADYINQYPINDGTNTLTLSQLSYQAISVLDAQNKLKSVSFSAITAGVLISDLQTPLPTAIGTVYVADVSSLAIGSNS